MARLHQQLFVHNVRKLYLVVARQKDSFLLSEDSVRHVLKFTQQAALWLGDGP
jgi:hypothetical protein